MDAILNHVRETYSKTLESPVFKAGDTVTVEYLIREVKQDLSVFKELFFREADLVLLKLLQFVKFLAVLVLSVSSL